MNNYYFTSDKWYGPLPEGEDGKTSVDKLTPLDKLPSGRIDTRLSEWAGQVKELRKDFLFDQICVGPDGCDCIGDECKSCKTIAVPIPDTSFVCMTMKQFNRLSNEQR